jgi:hypothetical protein
MGQGGKRPGAGRKPGGRTTRTAELVAKAVAGGITPLDYMLNILRTEPPEDAEPLIKLGMQAARFEAAKAAAPYVHPKLQPVDGSGSSDLSVKHALLVEFIGPAKK